MMESDPASAPAIWSVPQCPVTIEYSRRVLDDIRLAVVDAFFSLPRGGAEIGGVLLGKYEGSRVAIEDHAPLDCEHATGPSFALSSRDRARLESLLSGVHRRPGGIRPVGWYHSHTRSGIFLSEADLQIHNAYFPEPWQVALVLKPHTFQPTRAGFFVRERDGEIHGAASLREFNLEPLAAQPLPGPPAVPRSEDPHAAILVRRREPEGAGTMTTMASEPLAVAAVPARIEEPAIASQRIRFPAEQEPLDLTPPAFTQVAPERSWRWVGVVLAVVSGVGIGASAYQTREIWLRAPISWVRPRQSVSGPAALPGAGVGLRTLDTEGQLWIVWDRDSQVVRRATGGTLTIHDGPMIHAIELDAAHLQAGSFTYGRQSERIDIAIALNGPGGAHIREVTTYLGPLPERPPAPEEPLRKQNQKLSVDLNAERARSKKLQDAVNKLTREQQLKRLENQNPEGK